MENEHQSNTVCGTLSQKVFLRFQDFEPIGYAINFDIVKLDSEKNIKSS
jgi:hypothetical protein